MEAWKGSIARGRRKKISTIFFVFGRMKGDSSKVARGVGDGGVACAAALGGCLNRLVGDVSAILSAVEMDERDRFVRALLSG